MKYAILFALLLSANSNANPTAIEFGDSISLGYSGYARHNLCGKVNYRHNAWDVGAVPLCGANFTPYNLGQVITKGDNDGCAATLLDAVTTQLAGTHYSVILYNAGLHDMQQWVSSFGCGLNDTITYGSTMEQISSIVQDHADIVIWVDSTAVPNITGYIAGDQQVFNPIAESVAQEHGFYILNVRSIGQIPGNIHFTSAGYEEIAKQISDCILTALANAETNDCHH